ncbi:hypothetical protein BD410DRAFT_846179 [Rickenella mellea]|uniref:Ribonuclease H1 N-terminal domain-containing protein n=1 Tax=Rickenella mellea TaxID=50990 RepID=A0A4Y7PFS5_9AGAM|nr:hypothetical protein BD410DRAFT_846179 [Rickenella mellea]
MLKKMLELKRSQSFAPQTPNTANPEEGPRHVEEDALPSSQQSQFSHAEDDDTNPFFPPNLPVMSSSPVVPIEGQQGFPIYVSSSPLPPPNPFAPAQRVFLQQEQEDNIEFFINHPDPDPVVRHLPGPWYAITRGTEPGVVRGWDTTSPRVTGAAVFSRHDSELEAYLTYIRALRAGLAGPV